MVLVYFRTRSFSREVSFLGANRILSRIDSTHSVYLRRITFKKAPIIQWMHWVSHTHQVDAEMRNEPKCVEKKVGPRLLPGCMIMHPQYSHCTAVREFNKDGDASMAILL